MTNKIPFKPFFNPIVLHLYSFKTYGLLVLIMTYKNHFDLAILCKNST